MCAVRWSARTRLACLATALLGACSTGDAGGDTADAGARDAARLDAGDSGADGSPTEDGAAPDGHSPDGGADGGSPDDTAAIPVALPGCDDDATVKRIVTPADLSSLNDAAFRVFCIAPGDYRSAGRVEVTADGAEGAPRVLRYYDPDAPADESTHPYHMAPARRALLDRLTFSDAHHWVVDRVQLARGALQVTDGSSHVVLNRILMWQQSLDDGGSRSSD